MAMRVVPWFLVVLTTLPAWAGVCPNDRFEIHGIVIDAIGRPLENARVFVLLDQVSENKFLREGFRGRTFSTGADGQFSALMDCAAYREAAGGAPSPCAKKPKHLTVAAQHPGFKLQLKVFKLKELDIMDLGQSCAIALPQFKLTPG